MNIQPFEPSHILALAPEIVLVISAAVIMLADVNRGRERKRELGVVAALGFGAALVAGLLFTLPGLTADGQFGGMVRNDTAAFAFRTLFLFAGLMTALIATDSPVIGKEGEFYLVLTGSVIGMNFMALSTDLVMLYLAIEASSIALYALAGSLRESDRSAESGLKYFLFGAFTSTVLLYGFSLLYGFTGSTNLFEIGAVIGQAGVGGVPTQPVILALLMVLIGLGFKVSAVPFHFWAPDVYEGAPTPITAFLSVASKAAGFAVLLRLLLTIFPGYGAIWTGIIAALALLTMTVGNLLAMQQRNIKRLLAYSSIAQAGYILLGLAAYYNLNTDGNVGGEHAIGAVVYYLGMYTLTNLVAFGVIVLVSRVTGSDEIADFSGLSRKSPGLALAMLVALLSLGGIPPLAGFFGKLYLFAAAAEAGLMWLVIAGAVNALLALYYYLIVLKVIYLGQPKDEATFPISRPYAFALWIGSMGVILVGVIVGPFVQIAQAAGTNFIR